MELGGGARRARFLNNGVGSIAAEQLDVRELTVQSESAGTSSFSASQTANVIATGLGGVSVKGAAACTRSGAGPIRCGND